MKKVLVVVFMAIGSQALFAMHKDSEKQFLLNMKLMNVIHKNDPDVVGQVAALLNLGAQASIPEMIFLAIQKSGSADLVKLLIDNGADINKKKGGESCLFLACYDGNYEVAKLLIEHNAVITYDSLEIAGLESHVPLLFYLLKILTKQLDYKSKKTVLAGHLKNEGISPFAGLPLELIIHICSSYDKKKNIDVLKKIMDRKNDLNMNLFEVIGVRLLDASLSEILDPKSWSSDQQAEKIYAQLKNLSDKDILGTEYVVLPHEQEFGFFSFGPNPFTSPRREERVYMHGGIYVDKDFDH